MENILFANASKELVALTDLIKESIHGTEFEGHVFYVGGCVRDLILNHPLNDVDICVDIPNGGIKFATFMATKHNCYVEGSNPVTFKAYGTAKFQLFNHPLLGDMEIECVQTRKEQYHKDSRNPSTVFGTIDEDAQRRDLSINSLYYNISSERLIDPSGLGLDDLKNEVIRTPNDADVVFQDDPLRILRVIKFSTRYGWDIEKNTWFGMLNNAFRISIVSQERITTEISKMLVGYKPSTAIMKLYFCGILDKVMTDVYEMAKAKPNDLFLHTMKVLDMVQPKLEHRLAALFHDIGKVVYDTQNPKLDEFSAEIAEIDLKRMKLPNYVTDSVRNIVKNHRYFSTIQYGKMPSDKQIRKFIHDCKDDLVPTLDLMQSNLLNEGAEPKIILALFNKVEELVQKDDARKVKLPITGKDLIEKFNLKTSPKIGVLLDHLRDAYFENPNITKEECFAIAEEKLKNI